MVSADRDLLLFACSLPSAWEQMRFEGWSSHLVRTRGRAQGLKLHAKDARVETWKEPGRHCEEIIPALDCLPLGFLFCATNSPLTCLSLDMSGFTVECKSN